MKDDDLFYKLVSEMTADQYMGLMDAWWIIGEDSYVNLRRKLIELKETRKTLPEGSTPNIDAAIKRIDARIREIAKGVGTTSDGGRGNYSEMV
jgi:hypothetical protein